MRVSWHLGGMAYDRWLRMSLREAMLVHLELSDIIDRTDGEPPPGKLK